MKNIIFIILIFPFVGVAQNTFVLDDAFEQELINLGLDDVLNDSVYTSAIDTVLFKSIIWNKSILCYSNKGEN